MVIWRSLVTRMALRIQLSAWMPLYGNTSGSNNVAIGYSAGLSLTTGTYNIDIGNLGAAGESATIRVGTPGYQTNTYIAGISGMTVGGGVGVMVDSSGHLGTITSSARF